jgi:malyl-CoA/(S)-citramalyl-CoA lyase
MIDGTMQDDASVKQCRVVADLAATLSEDDPDLAKAYAEETLEGLTDD